jgi:hypothetical protein
VTNEKNLSDGLDERKHEPVDDSDLSILGRAVEEQRGHADFFSWHERDVAERGVAQALLENAGNEPGFPFSQLRSRMPNQDPPDCEALDCYGRRVAIEVTELVDPDSIVRARTDHSRRSRQVSPDALSWNRVLFVQRVGALLRSKDSKSLKGGPYEEYLVVIHTDEPELSHGVVLEWLSGHEFPAPAQIDRAYLLLSYDPASESYPVIRLRWSRRIAP